MLTTFGAHQTSTRYAFARRLLFDDYVAFGNPLQSRQQFTPAHVAIVAQHRYRRYASALDDHIALRRVFDAAHVTHVVIEATAPSKSRITEGLEETQERALNRSRRTRAAKCGDVLHGRLADAARIIALTAYETCIEAHRFPAYKFHTFHVGVDAAGNLAE